MQSLSYEDFRVQFMPSGAAGVSVRAGSAAGTETQPFELTFDIARAAGLVRHLKSGSSDTDGSDDGLHIGEALFDSLFSGRIGDLFNRTLGRVESRPDAGMRIRLEMDLNDPGVARLSGLPWELMRYRARRQYLSLSRSIQITRSVDVPRPLERGHVRPPLGILVAYANPSGTIDIDPEIVAEERRLLVESLHEITDLQVTVIDGASLSSIREALDRNTYHVLHYLGHGSFLKGAGEGLLNLEAAGDSDGLDRVDGVSLASILEGYHSLRLVVLNACKSAQSGLRDGQDPFRGVAPAMVMAGFPAVVAMQFIISVRAAVEFSKGFYESLLRTDSLEFAAADGRRRIFESEMDGVEWATPVVFTRLPGLKLFGLEDAGAPEAVPPKSPVSAEDVIDAVAAGVRGSASSDAWGALKGYLFERYVSTRLEADVQAFAKDPESAVRRKVLARRIDQTVDIEDRELQRLVRDVIPARAESDHSEAPPGIRQNVSGDKNIVVGEGGLKAGDINLS